MNQTLPNYADTMPDAFGGSAIPAQKVVKSPQRRFENLEAIACGILERMALGETLQAICRDPAMPAPNTIYKLAERNADFALKFARARQAGYDQIAAECMAIADDSQNDFLQKDGKTEFNSEHVQRSKLRIETRLKLLSKWDPKRYGEKSEVNLNAVVEQRLPLDQLQQEIQRLLSKSAIDVESIDNDSLT